MSEFMFQACQVFFPQNVALEQLSPFIQSPQLPQQPQMFVDCVDINATYVPPVRDPLCPTFQFELAPSQQLPRGPATGTKLLITETLLEGNQCGTDDCIHQFSFQLQTPLAPCDTLQILQPVVFEDLPYRDRMQVALVQFQALQDPDCRTRFGFEFHVPPAPPCPQIKLNVVTHDPCAPDGAAYCQQLLPGSFLQYLQCMQDVQACQDTQQGMQWPFFKIKRYPIPGAEDCEYGFQFQIGWPKLQCTTLQFDSVQATLLQDNDATRPEVHIQALGRTGSDDECVFQFSARLDMPVCPAVQTFTAIDYVLPRTTPDFDFTRTVYPQGEQDDRSCRWRFELELPKPILPQLQAVAAITVHQGPTYFNFEPSLTFTRTEPDFTTCDDGECVTRAKVQLITANPLKGAQLWCIPRRYVIQCNDDGTMKATPQKFIQVVGFPGANCP